MTALRERAREYFLLRRAEGAARLVTDAVREEARLRAALGRQKGAAAEQLWGGEHRAEGLALARDALLALLDAARVTARSLVDVTPAGEVSEDAWSVALAAVGVSADDLSRVRAAAQTAKSSVLPPLETEVTAAHETLYASWRDAAGVVQRAAALLTSRAPQVARLRGMRVAGAAVGAALLAAGLLYAVIPQEHRTATASAYLTGYGGYPATRAIDGDAATEWLLPNGTPGWLEVAFSRPRALRAVRILNARNPPYHDYAMRDFRIEAYAGTALVGTARGTFESIEPGTAINWRRVPLGAAGVTRVRIVCETFHGAAGGVAEVDFE